MENGGNQSKNVAYIAVINFDHYNETKVEKYLRIH